MFRRFLTLPVIIGPLPNQIVDGQPIVALPVMDNFNWILSQVNANVAGGGGPVNAASIPTYVGVGVVGGTANAITLTPTPSLSAYAAGNRFSFLATAPNTSAVTVNVSGLGPKSLVFADATALGGAEILAGATYDIEYNGTAFILMNSSQGSSIISWTPVVQFGGASVGITYSTQTGKAWKFGRMLYFAFGIVLSSKGSSTGSLTISGLPFTINASWPGSTPNSLYTSLVSFPSGDGYLTLLYNSGGTSLFIVNVRDGMASVGSLSDANFQNTSQVGGSGFYVV